MPLTGQAKTDYQREYMRKRRSNQRSNVTPGSVRPKRNNMSNPVELSVRPVKSDWHTLKGRAICQSLLEQLDEPEPQSYNSMKVGYVPPTGD